LHESIACIAARQLPRDNGINIKPQETGITNMTERVKMVPTEQMPPLIEAAGLPPAAASRTVYRVLGNNPTVLNVVATQIQTLIRKNSLPHRLRELMIMRIGWVTGSVYEWTSHWRICMELGIPPDDVLAVRDWQASTRLSAADRTVLQAADETLAGKTICDETWAAITRHVTAPGQQVELVVDIANWVFASILLRNLKIPLEEGITPWPPDGARPANAED
jgi:alkylhydroperoxidase family enzyme